MDYLSPCWQRDEWTRDANKNAPEDKTVAQKTDDRFATLRAQLICYTECKIREQCLSGALAREEDEQYIHHVYGGWTAAEREKMAGQGPLAFPARARDFRLDEERMNLFIGWTGTTEELTDFLGITPHSLANALRAYIWLLREMVADPGVLLQGEDSSGRVGLPQKPETVQAA